ncbi:MAG: hypothetical protein M3R27_00370 [Bacteroidota bacterium]|nr:hypothetical protein [Bacteroidota bacterium]
MKKLFIISTFLIIINFFSCKCDDTYTCPTLSDSTLSWLTLNLNDTIKYTNSSGDRIQFIVSSKTISPAYETKPCGPTGLGGCICKQNRCKSSGNLFAEADTIINNKNQYFVRIDETNNENIYNQYSTLFYTIFDFNNGINLLKPTELSPNDSLMPSLLVGNNTYSNVYVHMIDTTSTSNLNRKVWKVYYTQLGGVVGFRTRQNQNFYYRE